MAGIIVLGIISLGIGAGLFVPALFDKLSRIYHSRVSMERLDRFTAISIRQTTEKTISMDLRRRLQLVFVIAACGFGLSLYLYISEGRAQYIEELDRPDFGTGEKTYELWVTSGEERVGVSLTPSENEPDEAQEMEFFDGIAELAFKQALNGQSPEHITQNLKLAESIDGADISWNLSDMKNMNSYGQLRGDIPDEGRSIRLTAYITYHGYKREYFLDLTLYPLVRELTEEERLQAYVAENVTQEDDRLLLPTEYEGQGLIYELRRSEGYKTVAVLVVAMIIIGWLASEDKLDKEYKKWESELIADYPGILSRYSVLLASGLSMSEAWKRMAMEYERQLDKGKKPSGGYEELLLSVHDMKNTGQMEKAIERFGIRCRERHYRQLSTLMIQNLKKGSISMTEQLRKASEEAFELRKENARVVGERARAKLMIPSFILFGLTIAMVIYPAWAGL